MKALEGDSSYFFLMRGRWGGFVLEVPRAPLAGYLLSQGGLPRGSTGSSRDGGAGARRPLCPGAAAAAGGRGEETEDRGCGRRPGGASPWRGFALAGRLRGGLGTLHEHPWVLPSPPLSLRGGGGSVLAGPRAGLPSVPC